MKNEQKIWIGTVEIQRTLLRVVSESEYGVRNALLKEFRKLQKSASSSNCDLSKTPSWEDFSDYFGPWVQEARFNEVLWP